MFTCDKQRYYRDLAKSRGRIGSLAGQQCLYQLYILCNEDNDYTCSLILKVWLSYKVGIAQSNKIQYSV